MKNNKGRKRVKSARPKDKKDKYKTKIKKSELIPGFKQHAYLRETKQMVKKTKKKNALEKSDKRAKAQTFNSKSKNNFFKTEKGKMSQNPSTAEFNQIISNSGLSDINAKKRMLINKIRNNEIDPDKYMRFVEAASKGNEPDGEAQVMKKKFKNKQAHVVNFNYNSYIRIGA